MAARYPKLPPRRDDTHKGDYGRLLVVAGSRGMTGAAVLASLGAYRAGAGLVQIAVPDSLVPTVSASQLCATVASLPDKAGALGPGAADEVMRLLERADVLAMGPGLGTAAVTVEEVRQIVRLSDKPMVLDADALNAFQEHPDLLARGGAVRILTPHEGELGRLTGMPVDRIRRDRQRAAEEAARRFMAVVALKGSGTVVTDGKRTEINRTGHPGMATGGTGDVLTGIIAAFVGQGLSAWDAARLGVHLHGLAGDYAALKLGRTPLLATDLVDYFPTAFRKHHGRLA